MRDTSRKVGQAWHLSTQPRGEREAEIWLPGVVACSPWNQEAPSGKWGKKKDSMKSLGASLSLPMEKASERSVLSTSVPLVAGFGTD